jgi:hypothetical protein
MARRGFLFSLPIILPPSSFSATSCSTLIAIQVAALVAGFCCCIFSSTSTFAQTPLRGPLNYSARTDNCVTGVESGCGKRTPALTFLGQTGDSMPWYQIPGTIDQPNTAITDPDFHSYQIMLTSGQWAQSAGFQPTADFTVGSGEWDPFSQDDSLVLVQNNGGGYALLALNIPLIHAQRCSPTNPCVIFAGISTRASDNCVDGQVGRNCRTLNSGGSFSFSRVPGEATVIYERMGTGAGANVQVNKLTVSCFERRPGDFATTVCTFDRSPYVNFSSDSPTPCSIISPGYTSNSPWTGTFSVANDGSVAYAAGGAGPWSATARYSTPDSFLYPLDNNVGQNAFQATACWGLCQQSSEPDWDAYCPDAGQSCLDGAITWTNIGKIGSQGPGFDLLYFSPTKGCSRINTRLAKIYRGNGQGVGYPFGTPDPAGAFMTDSASGLFNICLLQYDVNGQAPPGGFTVAEIAGCQATAAYGSGALTDLGTLHDASIRINPDYFAWTPTGGGGIPATSYSDFQGTQSCRGAGSNYAENICYHYVWDVSTTLVRPFEEWVNYTGSNDIDGVSGSHETQGYGLEWNGELLTSHSYDEPNYNLEQGAELVGAPHLGLSLLRQALSTGITGAPWDAHGSGRAVNSSDTTPVFRFNTAVPAEGRLGCQPSNSGIQWHCAGGSSPTGYPGYTAGYNEITAMTTLPPVCSNSLGTYCQYRFAHNWGTGSSPQFAAQNEQGMISQDGRFAVLSTDAMGTRGSTSPDWQVGAYELGALINPVSGNANHSSFQIIDANCTSVSEPPIWPQLAGETVSDGGCNWTNVSQPAGTGNGNTGQLPCNGLRGDLNPLSGTIVQDGTTVFPVNSNVAANIYRASCSGTCTMTSVPNWSSDCPKFTSTCADDDITWTNIGPNDCRADVVLVDLLSAH